MQTGVKNFKDFIVQKHHFWTAVQTGVENFKDFIV